MNFETKETIERLYSRVLADVLPQIPPEERAAFSDAFRRSAGSLTRAAGDNGNGNGNGNGGTAFADLIGLGTEGSLPFGQLSVPPLVNDFDDSVVPTQINYAADLYFIYQFEQMKVFRAANVLIQLFHEGRMRLQRGPGARGLYLLEKQKPLRYQRRHRALAYRRVFNYGTGAPPPRAVIYQGFHRQFVAFIVSVAQFFRDMLVAEVIRGGQTIDQRPFGSQATIERVGADLRWQLDRVTYGNIVALVLETSEYLERILEIFEAPDVRKAFDANSKWDVIEEISKRFLGGAAQLAQRSRMAETGRNILKFVANNAFRADTPEDFRNAIRSVGPEAEEWIAAFRMTPEGQSFRGVQRTLRGALGLPVAAGT